MNGPDTLIIELKESADGDVDVHLMLKGPSVDPEIGDDELALTMLRIALFGVTAIMDRYGHMERDRIRSLLDGLFDRFGGREPGEPDQKAIRDILARLSLYNGKGTVN